MLSPLARSPSAEHAVIHPARGGRRGGSPEMTQQECQKSSKLGRQAGRGEPESTSPIFKGGGMPLSMPKTNVNFYETFQTTTAATDIMPQRKCHQLRPSYIVCRHLAKYLRMNQPSQGSQHCRCCQCTVGPQDHRHRNRESCNGSQDGCTNLWGESNVPWSIAWRRLAKYLRMTQPKQCNQHPRRGRRTSNRQYHRHRNLLPRNRSQDGCTTQRGESNPSG